MKHFFRDIKKYFSYAVYSAKAELKAEVSSSYLNWMWWILEPLCFMFIYMFIYSVVFQSRQEYLSLFIFIGLTVWTFFNKCITVSVKLVQNNSAIVSKVYLPKFILIVEKMLVSGFKMFVSLALIFVMMPFFGVKFSFSILLIIPLLLLFFLVTFGICTWMMHFGVFVEDLSYIVNIGLRLLFYVTGVFYPIASKVPSPFNMILLKGNPIAYIIDELRNAILYNIPMDYKFFGIWTVLSFLIIYIGIKMIYKYENSYVKVI